MSLKLTSVFIFLLTLTEVQPLKRLPVRVFHGLRDSCIGLRRKGYLHWGRCVETGAYALTFSKTLEEQAEVACEYFQYEAEDLAEGFYVLAFGQGGLVLKTLMKNCQGFATLVKRAIFVSVPHLGISKLPRAEDFRRLGKELTPEELAEENLRMEQVKALMKPEEQESMNKFIETETHTKKKSFGEKWDDFITAGKELVGGKTNFLTSGPSGYLLASDSRSKNVENLNARMHDPSYSAMSVVLNILITDDRVTVPNESSTFGDAFFDPKRQPLQFDPAKQLPALSFKDAGIGKLWDTGRMINCGSKGQLHATPLSNELATAFKLLFDEDQSAADYDESAKKQIEKFMQNYPAACHKQNFKRVRV